MAVAPPNEDAFMREVDDELRKAQLTSFWRRWGRWLIAGLVIGLVALAGFLYWQQHRQTLAGERSEQLSEALQQLGAGNAKAAEPALAALAEGGDPAYAAAARLTQAGVALAGNDVKAAVAGFKSMAEDESLPDPFRKLALIRWTTAEFDTLPPQTVIQRLGPLASAGQPWFGSAGELVALAHLKLNQPAQAGPIFAAIAKDPEVPATLRSRALKMAGALGFDAVMQPAAAPKE